MSIDTSKHRRFGVALTLIYLVVLGIVVACNWQAFVSLQPNAWGDFLAGSLGLLALFWLILGYFQQGGELRNSVKALEQQSKELSATVEQQRELVKSNEEAARLETERFLGSLKLEALKSQVEMRINAAALPGLLDRYHSSSEAFIATQQGIQSGRMSELSEETAALKEKIDHLIKYSDSLKNVDIPKDQEGLLNVVIDYHKAARQLSEHRQYLEGSLKIVQETRSTNALARSNLRSP